MTKVSLNSNRFTVSPSDVKISVVTASGDGEACARQCERSQLSLLICGEFLPVRLLIEVLAVVELVKFLGIC